MYTNCSTIDEHKLKLQNFNFTIKLSCMIHAQFDIKYKDNVYIRKVFIYIITLWVKESFCICSQPHGCATSKNGLKT